MRPRVRGEWAAENLILLHDAGGDGARDRDEGVIHLLRDGRFASNSSERNDCECQCIFCEALAFIAAQEGLCGRAKLKEEMVHNGFSRF
jgi:hypothetical protein